MRTLGLSAAGLRDGISVEPNLSQGQAYAVVRLDLKTGSPVEMAFDQEWAAGAGAGDKMADVAFLMSTVVHEFVHVEGAGEDQAYIYQLKFLDAAYKNRLISEKEYKAARSKLDGSVSAHLEGKGGGKAQGKDTCGGCLKYDALNPFGSWRKLIPGSQIHTMRMREVSQ